MFGPHLLQHTGPDGRPENLRPEMRMFELLALLGLLTAGAVADALIAPPPPEDDDPSLAEPPATRGAESDPAQADPSAFTFTASADQGSAGDDLLTARVGGDALSGLEGDDRLDGSAWDDQLDGGPGNDTLAGGGGHDLLSGGAGDDVLAGGAGNDWLGGGPGDDRLTGGAGEDSLIGGTDNDQLEGGAGDDWLAGGAGNDVLRGGPGADTLDGGPGDDLLIGDDDAAAVAGASWPMLAGTGQHPPTGNGTAPDPATGTIADDPTGARDYLNGGDGADLLLLGPQDVATGGAGADVFVLRSDADAPARIMDFHPGHDQILLLWPGAPSGVAAPPAGVEVVPGPTPNEVVILLNGRAVAQVTLPAPEPATAAEGAFGAPLAGLTAAQIGVLDANALPPLRGAISNST